MATPDRTEDGTAARFALAVIPAAIVPFLGSLIYFVFFAGETWARWAYGAVKLFTLVWPLVATRFILDRPLPKVDWSSPRHRAALGPGVIIGGGISLLMLILWASPMGAYVAAYEPQIRAKVVQLGVIDHYVPFALLLSFAHSGLEEYYWRWFLFGNLRTRLSYPAAGLLASLAFASHHAVILGQYFSLPWTALFSLAVAIGGATWCWMYQRQKTLTGAWLSHAMLDLVIFWIGYQMLF